MLMKKMRKQLIELLNIHGVSSDEGKVRDYLLPILASHTNDVHIDDYGNLLAKKTYGNGNGATLMLSAHMDTVHRVKKDRKLIEKDGVIRSNKGALGADDRAGITIILTVLEQMANIEFNGTIKIAFSREEEIGCIGSSKINPDFYKDVDLAIVVDRKGNRDIVAGCGSAFCSNSVGEFMEEVAEMTGMQGWKCVEGGISDAMTFAQEGINSVNLSAGYRNEHTDSEYVVLSDMKDTATLILQAIAVVNSFYKGFESVGYENKWAKTWYYKGSTSNYRYFEDCIEEDVWAEEQDDNGDVFVYELADDCIIQQGENEIVMSRASLKSIVDQLKCI